MVGRLLMLLLAATLAGCTDEGESMDTRDSMEATPERAPPEAQETVILSTAVSATPLATPEWPIDVPWPADLRIEFQRDVLVGGPGGELWIADGCSKSLDGETAVGPQSGPDVINCPGTAAGAYTSSLTGVLAEGSLTITAIPR